MSAIIAVSCNVDASSSYKLSASKWRAHADRPTDAASARHSHVPAVLFDDIVHASQPKAGTRESFDYIARPVEPVEHERDSSAGTPTP